MRLTTESAPTAVAADLAEFVTESPSSFHAAVSYTHLTLPTKA